MKNYFCLLFLFLVLFLPCRSFSAISINWDFDNGSLGSWEQQGNTIVLKPSEEGGSLWYYFQINGVLNQTLTFEFQSANNNYYGEHKLPVFSYDNKNWSYLYQRLIFNKENNGSNVHFQFSHTFKQDQAWIAYTPPYNNSRLDQWIEANKESTSLEVIELGKTPQNSLTLPILKISNPSVPSASKTTWAILCREDSYESASTWFGIGAADFLLSEDPLAKELLLQSQWLIVPIFDRDGVAEGHALHPDPILGPNYFWTEAWNETNVSFHEQRLFKSFFQKWKNDGNTIDGFFRVHSNGWQNNVIRPEQIDADAPEGENQNASIAFFRSLSSNYLPWFSLQDPLNSDTRISKYIHTLFPQAILSFIQTDFVYPNAFNTPYILYKPTIDIMTEGEKLARKVAEKIGIAPSEIPPQILAHDIYTSASSPSQQYHLRCVYQDALNRPPKTVQFRINEDVIHLTQITSETVNYKNGMIYSGFVNFPPDIQNASFYVSNGATEKEIEVIMPQFLSRSDN